MRDQGVLPAYERLTSRLEDADLKNLAAEIDLRARERKVTAELTDRTLAWFRRRREACASVLAGPHAGGRDGASDDDAREALKQKTELRKRVSRTSLK